MTSIANLSYLCPRFTTAPTSGKDQLCPDRYRAYQQPSLASTTSARPLRRAVAVAAIVTARPPLSAAPINVLVLEFHIARAIFVAIGAFARVSENRAIRGVRASPLGTARATAQDRDPAHRAGVPALIHGPLEAAHCFLG